VIRKAPEPMGAAVDTPAGLIGVKDTGVDDLLPNLLVSRFENLRRAMPLLRQIAQRDAELEIGIEDREDL
jgi:hypothetical protein